MYSGQAAINFVESVIHHDDTEESSHWNKYNSAFQYTGNGFRGLQGFGVYEEPRKFPLHLFEKFLQRKFRSMGRENFTYLDNLAKKIAKNQNRNYNLDLLRQVLTLSLLSEKIPGLKQGNLVGCVIGDGFASMASLLSGSNYASKVVLVNLTKTLLVDLWYLKLWMGTEKFQSAVNLVTNKEDLRTVLNTPSSRYANSIIAIRAVDCDLLSKCPIDFVINIASMQEMNPNNTSKYFSYLRNSNSNRPLYFYCCNRIQKQLPDGTVTKFFEYPWIRSDQIIIDELAPWHQEFYTFKPMFFRKYDGLHQHRLIIMAKNNI